MVISLISFPFSSSTATGSGIDRYTYELQMGFSNLGHNFPLFQKPLGSKFYRYSKSLGIVIPSFVLKKADLVHALSPYSFRLSKILGKKSVVTTVHDVIPFTWTPDHPTLFEKKRRPYASYAIEKSDFIIVPFNFTKEYMLNNFKTDGSKIKVINYGIDLDPFLKAGLGKKHNSHETSNLLFMGGVNPQSRGGSTVLKGFAEALRSTDSIFLTVSGRGQGLKKLEQEASQLGMADKVEFIDFIPEHDLPEFMSNFDIFVYPSPMGFSYLMLQSMASGVPVVTSNVFDIPEFVGSSGFTCDLEDYNCFASSILKFVDSESLHADMRQKSLERAENFSSENMARDTLNAYAEFLDVDSV